MKNQKTRIKKIREEKNKIKYFINLDDVSKDKIKDEILRLRKREKSHFEIQTEIMKKFNVEVSYSLVIKICKKGNK